MKTPAGVPAWSSSEITPRRGRERWWRGRRFLAVVGVLLALSTSLGVIGAHPLPAMAATDGPLSVLGSVPAFQDTRPGAVIDINFMVRNSSNTRHFTASWRNQPAAIVPGALDCEPGPELTNRGMYGKELAPNSTYLIHCTTEVPFTTAASVSVAKSVFIDDWLNTINEFVTFPVDHRYVQLVGHGNVTPGGTVTGVTFSSSAVGFPTAPGPFSYEWRIYDVPSGALVVHTTTTSTNASSITVPRALLTPIPLGAGLFRWRAVASVIVTRGGVSGTAMTPTVTASGA